MIITTTYAHSLVGRMCSGDGQVQLVPFRIDPDSSVEVLGHGLNEAGEPSIVCPPGTAALVADTRVRVDITKGLADWNVQGVLASAHLLAYVDWQEAEGPMDPEVGTLRFGEVHLHGPGGTLTLPHSALGCQPLDISEEVESYERMMGLGEEQLMTMAWDVVLGFGEGEVINDKPIELCEHARSMAFIGDVDEAHLLVIVIEAGRQLTVLMPLPEIPDIKPASD